MKLTFSFSNSKWAFRTIYLYPIKNEALFSIHSRTPSGMSLLARSLSVLRSLSPKLPGYSVFYCYERLSSSSGGADQPRSRDWVVMSSEVNFKRKFDDFRRAFKEHMDSIQNIHPMGTPDWVLLYEQEFDKQFEKFLSDYKQFKDNSHPMVLRSDIDHPPPPEEIGRKKLEKQLGCFRHGLERFSERTGKILSIHPTIMSTIWAMTNGYSSSIDNRNTSVAKTGLQCTSRNLSNLVTSVFAQKTSETNDDPAQKAFYEHRKFIVRRNLLLDDCLRLNNTVTWSCKEVIGFVHRSRWMLNHDILQDTSIFSVIRATKINDLFVMLENLDDEYLWEFRADYRPAMQEFVEAMLFFNFCKSDVLLALEDINRMLMISTGYGNTIQIDMEDYILGLADVTGELMTLAIRLVGRGEYEYSQNIYMIMRKICKDISLIANDENIGKSKKEIDLKMVEARKNVNKVSLVLSVNKLQEGSEADTMID